MVRLYMDTQLREYQITPVQSHIIMFLKHQDDKLDITQRDLERELRLKASTVNGLVERMEERGLIRRILCKSDARCRLVQLTDNGRAMAASFSEAVERAEALIQSALTAEEEATLRGLLSRLISNLESEVSKK